MEQKVIYEILNVKEAYELPSTLMEILFKQEERNKLFDNILKTEVDFSKDIFQTWYEENLSNRKELKQDYTPACLTKLVSKLIGKVNKVNDICSGIGGLTFPIWQNNKDAYFYLQELSKQSIPFLLFNLSIRGINAIVYNGDVLTNEYSHIYKITNNGKYSDIEEVNDNISIKVDCVVSNPPYSISATLNPLDERFFNRTLPPTSKADFGFVLDGISKLEDNGIAIFILPHGVLFRDKKEKEIRQELIKENLIDSIIGLPTNTFSNTSIPVCLLVLKKGRKTKDILFINAEKECVKNGKLNVMNDEHIEKTLNAYKLRTNIERFSHVATLEEIQKNDYNLNIPRYVDTTDPKANETRPISEIVNELIELDKEYKETLMSFAKLLEELEPSSVCDEKTSQDFKQAKEKNIDYLKNYESNEKAYLNMLKTMEIESARISKACKKVVKLKDVATIERAVKNKAYQKGTTLVQLSATKGETFYLNESIQVDSKYAVVIPNIDINSKYLFYNLKYCIEHNLDRIKNGLNIVVKDLEDIELNWLENTNDQQAFNNLLDANEVLLLNTEQSIESAKEEKKFYLNNMFI